MKITRIDTFLMQAGAPEDRAWASDKAGVQTSSRNWLFVKVHTDEGVYGVGECSGWPRVIEAACAIWPPCWSARTRSTSRSCGRR